MFKKDKRNILILSLFLLTIILIFFLALTMIKYHELLTDMSLESNTSSGFTAQTTETYSSLPSGVTEVPSNAEQSTTKPNEETDYFAIGSKEMKVCQCYMFGGSDIDDFINTLNPPDSKEYIDKVGIERWYFKQGVEIDVDSFNDNPTLTNYVFLNSTCTLQTDKNIGIGSTQRQVIDAYENEINPDQSDADLVVVGRKDHGLIFVIEDEKVSAIFIATYGFTAETDILLIGRN